MPVSLSATSTAGDFGATALFTELFGKEIKHSIANFAGGLCLFLLWTLFLCKRIACIGFFSKVGNFNMICRGPMDRYCVSSASETDIWMCQISATASFSFLLVLSLECLTSPVAGSLLLVLPLDISQSLFALMWTCASTY